MVPISEYRLWVAHIDAKWQDYTPESYEFALLRQVIVSTVAKNPGKLQDHHISSYFKEPEKEWKWMTEEEQQEFKRRKRKEMHKWIGKNGKSRNTNA